MNTFIQSAESRETSVEIMEAIAHLAHYGNQEAERIWSSPTCSEVEHITQIVTRYGLDDPSCYYWGYSDNRWAH